LQRHRNLSFSSDVRVQNQLIATDRELDVADRAVLVRKDVIVDQVGKIGGTDRDSRVLNPYGDRTLVIEGRQFCILYGYNTLFSNSVLKSLYKNHDTYVNQVTRETNDLVKQRFWLRADGAVVKKQAAHANVP
jgi:hypothetical protein